MRYVSAESESERWEEIFDQRYPVVGPKGKVEMVFADQLGAAVLLDFTLVGELFNRYLEHAGKIPRRESQAKRRVIVAVGGSFLDGSRGEQVVERYSLKRHDVLAPGKVIRLMDENRDPIVQVDLARPRQMSTVLKRGASRKDWSGDDPWGKPEVALGFGGQILAGLVAEGFIQPDQIGVDDERLLELLSVANLAETGVGRLLRLPAHRLEVLAQPGGWRAGNPLAAEYWLAAKLASLFLEL